VRPWFHSDLHSWVPSFLYPEYNRKLSIGAIWNLVKERGSFNLVADFGAQRACFNAKVYRDRKGSNPNTIHSFTSVIASRRFDASSSSQSSWLSIGQHLQFAGKPYAFSAMPSRTSTKPATRIHYCTQVHSLLSVLQIPSTQTVITSDQLHRAQSSFSKWRVTQLYQRFPASYEPWRSVIFTSKRTRHWSIS
jgi:hypothetical protein